jgi:hypothetical protein
MNYLIVILFFDSGGLLVVMPFCEEGFSILEGWNMRTKRGQWLRECDSAEYLLIVNRGLAREALKRKNAKGKLAVVLNRKNIA